ncbi:hypothetical protein [Massilia cavernae]|uniref:hypothetical protein n=1 Tax=Massilia cavernae TaxID=2320864 RepID=UPI001E3C3029|nr:hypothetical protein [Massilia cavernae]
MPVDKAQKSIAAALARLGWAAGPDSARPYHSPAAADGADGAGRYLGTVLVVRSGWSAVEFTRLPSDTFVGLRQYNAPVEKQSLAALRCIHLAL